MERICVHVDLDETFKEISDERLALEVARRVSRSTPSDSRYQYFMDLFKTEMELRGWKVIPPAYLAKAQEDRADKA